MILLISRNLPRGSGVRNYKFKIYFCCWTRRNSSQNSQTLYFECAPFPVNCFNNKKKPSNFPRELKSANVVPVPKTGDSLCKSNYRPISILPAVSKVKTNKHLL